MNIETKTVREYSYSDREGTKDEYLHFGWQHTEDTEVHIGRGYKKAYVLARDKDMPNYAEISRLENEYFDLKRKQKTYVPMEASNVFWAFVFLLIPGIIYVAVKWTQKKKINEHNAEMQRQMQEVVSKVKAYL